MVGIWLPILMSAVFVFVASSILHMVIPVHKGDYGKLPGEPDILESMRGHKVAPGSYMFPCADSMKAMAMGKALATWFIYSIVISIFVGYLGSFSLESGAEYGLVFRVTGTAAILGYAMNSVVDSIWKGVSWTITSKFVFDGVVYGLVTAGAFGWLWPAA